MSRSQNERTFVDPSNNGRQEFPSLEQSATLSLSVIVPSYKEEQRCKGYVHKNNSTTIKCFYTVPVMMDEALQYLEKRKVSAQCLLSLHSNVCKLNCPMEMNFDWCQIMLLVKRMDCYFVLCWM